jgi:hypothetical protein
LFRAFLGILSSRPPAPPADCPYSNPSPMKLFPRPLGTGTVCEALPPLDASGAGLSTACRVPTSGFRSRAHPSSCPPN